MKIKNLIVLATLALAPAILVGCGDDPVVTAEQKKADRARDERQKAMEELVRRANAEPLNVQHILVKYAGCEGAGGVSRTKEQAATLIKELHEQVIAGNADFSQLARENSDDPSAGVGGHMGNVKPHALVGQFVAATKALKIGETSEPIQTQFGFHIIRRHEIAEVYNAAHILILHMDAKNAPKGTKLSHREALALANEIYSLCNEPAEQADGTTPNRAARSKRFAELALKHSNGPAATRGGQMGNFTVAELPSYYADAGKVCSELEIDEISKPYETDFGVHLVKRNKVPVQKVPQIYSAKHVLVMHKNAPRAEQSCTRSREDALERIQLVQSKLEAGAKFESLATEFSDCPSGKNGGDLETFLSTSMVPEFSEATDKCPVGEYTDIIESAFGYHIIYRYK